MSRELWSCGCGCGGRILDIRISGVEWESAFGRYPTVGCYANGIIDLPLWRITRCHGHVHEGWRILGM